MWWLKEGVVGVGIWGWMGVVELDGRDEEFEDGDVMLL